MTHVVVEQVFEEPISDEKLAGFAQRLDGCLELREGAWVRSYVAADRKRVTCEFVAPDCESVREAFRSAGVKFERAWSATVYAVEDNPTLADKLRHLGVHSQQEQ
jgi:hypothetical protein